MILDEVEVVTVERLSPSYVRVELASPALADFGVDGPLLDQRIKLIFPGSSGRVPALWDGEGEEEDWWSTWIARPADERGHMRTYTVRDVRGSGADTRLVVDLVLHLADGATRSRARSGPPQAVAGDRLVVMAPRRGHDVRRHRVRPGRRAAAAHRRRRDRRARRVRHPARPAGRRGRGGVRRGAGVRRRPRRARAARRERDLARRATAHRWAKLAAAVLDHLGDPEPPAEVADDEVDPDLWETPVYSSATESAPEDGNVESPRDPGRSR